MRKLCASIFAPLIVLGLAACATQPATDAAPTWQEQYDLGIRYLSEGNYEEAIIAFTAAIEIDPKRPEAYVGRGDAYIGNGETKNNLAAALADYEAALDIDSSNIEAWLRLADTYANQGNHTRAAEILEQAIAVLGETEALTQKYYDLLRTGDGHYEDLDEADRTLLAELEIALKAQDWESAVAIQSGAACAALANRLPLNEEERFSVNYYPDDSTSVTFFRISEEGETTNHMDLICGSGGNGYFVASVYSPSHYYMNVVEFSDGFVNGPLTSYNIRWENGETQYFTVTGTMENGAPVGGVLYSYADGQTRTSEGEGFHTWPEWPAALN